MTKLRTCVHCIVKNEDRFIEYGIRSLVDSVDRIIIFDTGSTDNTLPILAKLANEFGNIEVHEKGESDKARHTILRQEMLDLSTEDWIIILDGDEVWSEELKIEVQHTIKTSPLETIGIFLPCYNCVGDIFHDYKRDSTFKVVSSSTRIMLRVFRNNLGIRWHGDYEQDVLVNKSEIQAFNSDNSVIADNRFWHLTHMVRSTRDAEVYSSGASRYKKIRPTYLLIGKKIKDPIPNVFIGSEYEMKKLTFLGACLGLLKLAVILYKKQQN